MVILNFEAKLLTYPKTKHEVRMDPRIFQWDDATWASCNNFTNLVRLILCGCLKPESSLWPFFTKNGKFNKGTVLLAMASDSENLRVTRVEQSRPLDQSQSTGRTSPLLVNAFPFIPIKEHKADSSKKTHKFSLSFPCFLSWILIESTRKILALSQCYCLRITWNLTWEMVRFP